MELYQDPVKIYQPRTDKTRKRGQNISEKQEEIKFILANSDHCGDKICGYPEKVNEIITDTKILQPARSSVSPSLPGAFFSWKAHGVSPVSSW